MPKLLRTSCDLPFSRDNAKGFLPWMIAVMAGLTTLLVALALLLSSSLTAQQRDASAGVSIQVPSERVSPALTSAVQETLARINLLEEISEVPPERLRAQLAPWIGELKNPENWPLPYVVRATLRDGTNTDEALATLRAQMESLHPDIRVDGTAVWAQQYAQMVGVIQMVLYSLALLLMTALLTLVVFASRTAMRLHLPAVLLLHGLGASDDYIVRQFARNAFTLVVKGAAIGASAAVLLLIALGVFVHQINPTLFPRIDVNLTHGALLVLLPACATLAGVWASRISTQRYLRRLP